MFVVHPNSPCVRQASRQSSSSSSNGLNQCLSTGQREIQITVFYPYSSVSNKTTMFSLTAVVTVKNVRAIYLRAGLDFVCVHLFISPEIHRFLAVKRP